MWALTLVALAALVVLWHWRRSGQRWSDFLAMSLVRAFTGLWHGWSSNRRAPLPATGPAILYSNHTCSADPAFLESGCSRWLSFVIAREFYPRGPLRHVFDFLCCVPVGRTGQDVGGLRAALRRLSEGRVLCIFPEGNLSNAGNRFPRSGRAGVALLALRSKAPIIPARILGGPQESEILPGWLKPSRVRVIYGSPVDLSAYYDRPINRRLLEQVTRLLMNRINELDRSGQNGSPAR